ncbi:MAG: tRNA (adenosine(37)-N6)-threonylcarbamoyltransferase complex dimerization subunit type 1 TsaB [Kordiimonas sp.]
MTILAIDTSETHCSAALLTSDAREFSRMEDIGRGHAERLLPMIEELFAEAGQAYADLTRVAVVTGPGTFTGLRIGLSVARGLALSLNIPCVGLMSFPVIAAGVKADKEQLVHVVTKGRGGQVFYQAYIGEQSGLPLGLGVPVNVDVEEVDEAIAAKPGLVCGSGVALLQNFEGPSEGVAVDPVVLAKMARNVDPQNHPPEPTYLRQADAIKAKAVFEIQAG